jgi:hypothetical protein
LKVIRILRLKALDGASGANTVNVIIPIPDKQRPNFLLILSEKKGGKTGRSSFAKASDFARASPDKSEDRMERWVIERSF